MKATEILKRLMAEMTSVEVKFEKMSLENGTVFEAEKFEGGNEIFIVTEEARIAVPVGDYAMEDGRILVVSEEGIIDRIDEKREEEVEVEVPVEEIEASEEDSKKEEKKMADEDNYVTVDDWRGMEKRIQNLEDAIADLKSDKVEASSEIEELKSENTKLSAESATKPIKHNPENANKIEERDTHKGPLTSFERVLQHLNK